MHNGDPWHSDHRPLIISLDNDGPKNLGGQPGGYKFEAAWLEEESWKEVIKDAWEGAATHGNVPLADLLKTVEDDLQLWNTNVLGVLEKNLKKVKKELEACRRGLLGDEAVKREVVLRPAGEEGEAGSSN